MSAARFSLLPRQSAGRIPAAGKTLSRFVLASWGRGGAGVGFQLFPSVPTSQSAARQFGRSAQKVLRGGLLRLFLFALSCSKNLSQMQS